MHGFIKGCLSFFFLVLFNRLVEYVRNKPRRADPFLEDIVQREWRCGQGGAEVAYHHQVHYLPITGQRGHPIHASYDDYMLVTFSDNVVGFFIDLIS